MWCGGGNAPPSCFCLGHKSLLLGSVSGIELWTLLNMQILAEIFGMSAKDYIAYVDNRPREGFLMYVCGIFMT